MAKNALIFGDSYSTFQDCIPDGYAVYYSGSREDSDVNTPADTWWYQVMEQSGMNLVQNNSWSGSTIGYTGYDHTDCSHTNSFIYRLRELTDAGFFSENEIHSVFVFGGTNDNWADAPLGTMKHDAFSEEDLYQVLPAISYFFQTLRCTVPQATIYCLINTELKPEITDGFKEVCQRFGVKPVQFDKIDKVNGHPTARGMREISKQVLSTIQN